MKIKLTNKDKFYTVGNGENNLGGLCFCGSWLLQTKRMYVKPPLAFWRANSNEQQQRFRFMETDWKGNYKFMSTSKKNADYNGAGFRCEKCNHKIIILKDYSIYKNLKYYERDIDLYYKED